MTYAKQYPEVLMTVVFAICLIAVFYANHVHNNAMVQWAQNLAGQAFASIATLVVKGAFGAQQTTVSTPSTQTVTKQTES